MTYSEFLMDFVEDTAPKLSNWEVSYIINDIYILKLDKHVYITKFNSTIYNSLFDNFILVDRDLLIYLCYMHGTRYDI